MAYSTSFIFSILLLLLIAVVNGTRPSPASDNVDNKQKECFDSDAGVNSAGFGGPNTAGFGGGAGPTGPGSTDAAGGGIPSFTDLDHSGPAAASGTYIPGFDDTFVPNPGYEIPTSSGSVPVP